jgi:starch phosphorylase
VTETRTGPMTFDLDTGRRLQRLGFAADPGDWTDRYLLCDHLVDPLSAKDRQRYEATAKFVRDLIAHRWVESRRVHREQRPKQICYVSMEYLLGRSLRNNLMNMRADPVVEEAIRDAGWDLEELLDEEPDAGLGNGGLGRLAACFMESLATMQYSAIGYGLRYEYGIFRQSLHNGWQVEEPDNWLMQIDPWEVPRPGKVYRVPLNASFELVDSQLRLKPGNPSHLLGIAYDRPVVGYGARCINTLRLWAAAAPQTFDFGDFSRGEFVSAVIGNVASESLTRVLYPDDSTERGRGLRFIQQYFLVSCTIQDIISHARQAEDFTWDKLPERFAVQLNDTHPALAVAELMRVLLDEAHLSWEQAWDISVRTLAYTNHTLLPEALERWPVRFFDVLIPRHLEIVYEINRRFIDELRARFPSDEARVARMSLIEEGPDRRVRMAHLATVGSHSVNGVARIHSNLLRDHVLRDFADVFPERFNNKTNGVTPRRWLQQSNASVAGLITEAIGGAWVDDLAHVSALKPLANDAAYRERFMSAKRAAKVTFCDWLRRTTGRQIDPDRVFDSQIKRIHEYKRQLLNAIHIVMLYNRIRSNPDEAIVPRTFFFAGKAAPAYGFAKLVIKLISDIGRKLESEPDVHDRLSVIFLREYNVTLAERLIPASDVSEQISTAGYEASGTGNMKFMMNGALTIGTRDGATIEMAEEAGEENMFLFGLTAEQVVETRGWYDPWWHYWNEPETRAALDLIFSNHFNPSEPGIFEPLRDRLLHQGDNYMVLADLKAYAGAHRRVARTYADPHEWAKRAIINVASSGRFSSDRTIRDYANDIWDARPSPVV